MVEKFDVILAGGGTGGHLFPALAVADELQRRHKELKIGFIGSHNGLETTLVPQAGYPLHTLPLAGMKGRGLLRRASAAVAAGIGTLRSALWLTRRGVRLVIGAGGFASGPAVLAARLTGRRTLLMEQNHFPGATNRALAGGAAAVCLPGPEAMPRIGGNRFVTGNPVRAEFHQIPALQSNDDPTLLIFGGSRGARSLNQAMIRALPILAAQPNPPRIVHQTGPHDLDEVRRAYETIWPAERYEVLSFFDDMPQRFAAADLILGRSGAGTVAELAAAGRPAMLVPYPYAADDHQRHNAESLVHADAAVMTLDEDLTGEEWSQSLIELLGDSARRIRMGQAARRQAKPDAASRIAELALTLLEEEVA